MEQLGPKASLAKQKKKGGGNHESKQALRNFSKSPEVESF